MSNAYCNLDQLRDYYDTRVVGQLSNDVNARTADDNRVQALLDTAASELESAIMVRYTLPLINQHAVLRRWVAVKAMAFNFSRRNDRPKDLEADLKWADDWMKSLLERVVGLPGETSGVLPSLLSSGSFTGKSRFDHVPHFDRPPTSTSTSKGQ